MGQSVTAQNLAGLEGRTAALTPDMGKQGANMGKR
jgi:hypothetical protein